MRYIIMLLVLASCEIKLKSDPVKQEVSQSGESRTYIVLRIEFIQQIKDLCLQSNIRPEGVDDIIYNKVVADCTLNNLDLFNISKPKTLDFIGQYCASGADLSKFSLEEQINITAACDMLAP